MPNILFASNNLAHWPTAVATSQVGTFDPNRVPYAIMLEKDEILSSPSFIPTPGDDTWFHFRFYPQDNDYNGDKVLLQAFDNSGNVLFSMRDRPGVYFHTLSIELTDGSTTIQENSSIPFTNEKVNSIDVHFHVDGLGIELRTYVNQGLASELILNSNPNNLTAPSRFSIGHAFGDEDSTMPVSEIIVADGDTRNARLDLLRPNQSGTYTDWIGQVNVLSDDDPTTGLTTILANERYSAFLTDYTGASNISNIVAVSSTTRGINSPSKLKHSIRMGGVDYDSAEIDIDFPLQYNLTDWNINPATSLPWVGDEIELIETGFVSVA